MAARVRIPLARVDETFQALGSTVRIVIASPDARGLLVRARALLSEFEACASRFRPDSELCALNADPRAVVPASPLLRDAVRSALWCARRSGGLVDPCVLDALEAAGYRESFALGAAAADASGAAGTAFAGTAAAATAAAATAAAGSAAVGAAGAAAVPLTSRRNLDARRLDVDMRRELDARHAPAAGATGATGAAGAAGATGAAAAARAAGAARGAHGAPAARPDHPARPARPHPAAVWRAFRVDDRRGTIVRPPGVGIDLGGSGKGHAADRVAALLRSASAWVVDAGGDVRIGGVREVLVGHPLQPAPAARLRIADGAAATSSIVRRSWRTADGRVGHHLIDPATGRPAWTGLLSVTALAPTTLEAETLAKAALLSGPDGARRLLARFGGVVIGASGDVERVGPLPEWSDRPDGGTARPGPGPAEIGPDRPDGATARAVREPTEIEMEAAA